MATPMQYLKKSSIGGSHRVIKPNGVGHSIVDLCQGLEVGVPDERLEEVDVFVPGESLLSEGLQYATQLRKHL